MREIKFRAWDKRRKKWLNQKDYILRPNGDIAGINGGSGAVPEWEINQYTGINDKQGIEIYEGDILWDEHHEEIEIVRFKNGQFCTDGYSCDDISDLKKIGNIYENPELKEG